MSDPTAEPPAGGLPRFGPLQPLIDDPDISHITVTAGKPVWVMRAGQQMLLERFAFADDIAVRALVEHITGRSTVAVPWLTHELPGDMFLEAVFPPYTPAVRFSVFKPARAPERWEELVDQGALPAWTARQLAEAVAEHATILVMGPPGAGLLALLNVLAASLPDGEPYAVVEPRRDLTFSRGQHRVTRVPGARDPEDPGTLVRAALGQRPAWLVAGQVTGRGEAALFAALAEDRVRALAVVSINPPRDVAEAIESLELRAGGPDLESARRQLAQAAPLVVLTSEVNARQPGRGWRVRSIFAITGLDEGRVTWSELWRTNAASGELVPTGAPFEPARAWPPTPAADEAVLSVEAADSPDEDPPARHPLTTHLHDSRLLQEWIRPDQPFPPGPAGPGCPACTALEEEVAYLRAAPGVDETALRHARNRWGLHQGVHRWIELVLERLLEPVEAEALRSPAWEGERGRPILRCPARPGGEATQVFFLLHRYRFGTFVSASMRNTAEGPRLRLLDDRGALLDLGGLTAGYRGQGPRTTVWVLWAAGFEDRFDRIEQGVPFTVVEDLVFTHEEFELTPASGA